MVLGACGGGSDDSDSGDSGGDASTEGPKSQAGAGADESEGATAGGVLRIGMEAESDGLNPTTNRFAVAGLQMGNAVFDTLAASDEDGNPVPYLAESFTPNADFTEWTVTLRPNVKFHDGTALTAEAIVANITAQANDALVGRAVKPVLAETDFVAATGELTAVVRMRQPSAHFPSYLTGQLGMVASPTWLEAAKANPDLNQKPVGTGPFKFDSRTKDSQTRVVRNDEWWGKGVVGDGPYLDAIEFYPVVSAARRADQLVAGELDVLHTTDVPTETRLEGESSLTTVSDELGEETFLQMNTEKAPFDDARVREAVVLATSNKSYNDLINEGKLTLAQSMFHPDLKWADPNITQEYDPAKAKELVAAVCAEKADLCKGGKVTIVAAHDDGKADYAAEVAALAAAGGDALVIAGYVDQGGSGILRGALDSGAFETFVFPDGMVGETLEKNFGKEIDGSFGQMPSSEGAGHDKFLAAAKEAGFDGTSVYSGEAYDAAALMLLAMQAAGSTDPKVYKDKILEIANGPGEKILPGELAKGLELLKEGKAIDYDGATSVTFVNGRENAGTFREIAIKDGKIETVTYR
jgi:ABC-type transport system substrate-binding protein